MYNDKEKENIKRSIVNLVSELSMRKKLYHQKYMELEDLGKTISFIERQIEEAKEELEGRE